MTERANAKINLFLDVVSRREDGFHNLSSIMQTVSLCDVLNFDFKESVAIDIRLTSNIQEIISEDNLVCRAARLYLVRAGITARVDVDLFKNIPIGAGLGGGSADAAATFRAMNRHFKFFDDKAILDMCAEIGSDVPFCYIGGTALCEGRGEIITPIRFDRKIKYVVAIGEERISTPKAYKELDERFAYFDGSVKKVAETINKCLVYDEAGGGLPLYNIFEEIFDSNSEVERIKSLMVENGAEVALMTGSGPAVFGIFSSADNADFVSDKLKKLGISAFYAESVCV